MLSPEGEKSAQLSTCSVKRVYTFFTFSTDVSDHNVLHPSYFVPKFPDPETKVGLLAIEEICGVKPAESQAKIPSDYQGGPDHPRNASRQLGKVALNVLLSRVTPRGRTLERSVGGKDFCSG
jgi:hypothetical protein